jgi:hypothetical protein
MLADIGYICQHAICHWAYLIGWHPWSRDASRGLKRAVGRNLRREGVRQRSFIDIADKAGVSHGSPVRRSRQGANQIMGFIRLRGARLFIVLPAEAVEIGPPIREHYARPCGAATGRAGPDAGASAASGHNSGAAPACLAPT